MDIMMLSIIACGLQFKRKVFLLVNNIQEIQEKKQ